MKGCVEKTQALCHLRTLPQTPLQATVRSQQAVLCGSLQQCKPGVWIELQRLYPIHPTCPFPCLHQHPCSSASLIFSLTAASPGTLLLSMLTCLPSTLDVFVAFSQLATQTRTGKRRSHCHMWGSEGNSKRARCRAARAVG